MQGHAPSAAEYSFINPKLFFGSDKSQVIYEVNHIGQYSNKEIGISGYGHRYRAVIYYLAQAKRLQLLKKSIRSLHRYFLCDYNYPVIIFHEVHSE
jgi:hypothetical protein